jgi:hypothetical protein
MIYASARFDPMRSWSRIANKGTATRQHARADPHEGGWFLIRKPTSIPRRESAQGGGCVKRQLPPGIQQSNVATHADTTLIFRLIYLKGNKIAHVCRANDFSHSLGGKRLSVRHRYHATPKLGRVVNPDDASASPRMRSSCRSSDGSSLIPPCHSGARRSREPGNEVHRA